MTPFKFFVSLLICVVSVFTAILGFNYCFMFVLHDELYFYSGARLQEVVHSSRILFLHHT